MMFLSLRPNCVSGDLSVVIDGSGGFAVASLLPINVRRRGEGGRGDTLEALRSSRDSHNWLMATEASVHVGGVLK